MRTTKLLIFSLSLLLLISCQESPESESTCYRKSDPPRNSEKVTIEQGLWGDVWFWSGDFMPVGRGEICQIIRKVLIYELTTNEDVEKVDYSPFYTKIHTKLVTSVYSDSQGFFELELEPGTYSIFIQEGDKIYSNRFSSQGIFPVTVKSGELSEIRFDINYEATF
ncbi:hypothetical protein D1614_08535 [Maribellus luteus]|uniref:Carboxypeptidase regulatory-like domain-containing protein n=1 Tax=Maribellus luteus TaxID=2305463 RepID=A0A399T3X3_9BACT|nr:hypothetical protein [Maribellus luteus]RIJ48573.1 hypothetical protein D1614_08535 [Maribellus luteus]